MIKRIADDEFINLTLKIAAKTFFGLEDLRESEKIRELTESLKIIYSSNNRISWFADNFMPTAKNRRFKKAVADINLLITDIISERRSDSSEMSNLLSVLLAVNEGNSEKQIRDEIMTFLIAGHETTAITLTWAWSLLAKNSQAADKLYAEVKSLETAEIEHFSKLQYTNQVIKETLRLYPPNRSVSREMRKSAIIAGFNIPKGAQIVMPQWVMQRDEKYFPAPENFIPERWTPIFEKELPKYAYFPFGLGNRSCIGRSFAMMEVALILSIAARRFQFNLDDKTAPHPLPVILLRPESKINFTVKKR